MREGRSLAESARKNERLAGGRATTTARKREEADLLFHRIGITFAVYGEEAGTERLIPFDIVPRIIAAQEWRRIEQGLRQRVQALNAFLHDIYHEGAILKAGRIPAEQVLGNSQHRREMAGVDVAGKIHAHVAGIDLVCADHGGRLAEYYVLEDNRASTRSPTRSAAPTSGRWTSRWSAKRPWPRVRVFPSLEAQNERLRELLR